MNNKQRLIEHILVFLQHDFLKDFVEASINKRHLYCACANLHAIVKPGAPGFLILLLFLYQYVCVHLPPRAIITSGMIWCDKDCVIS